MILIYLFLAQETYSFQFEGTRLQIEFTVKPFQQDQKMEWIEGLLWIEGRFAFGTDGQCCPKTQIVGMTIRNADSEVRDVEPDLFSDLFDPHFSLRSTGYALGEDGTLLFFMNGSDAAGSYTAIWMVSETECKRFSPQFGPNINAKNFNLLLSPPTIQ